jgi:hypothetical protein
MAYTCPDCDFEIKNDDFEYCPMCGESLYADAPGIDYGYLIGSFFMLLAIGVLVLVVTKIWLFAPCGSLTIYNLEKKFDATISHITDLENYEANGQKIPETLYAILADDFRTVANDTYPECQIKVAEEMLCTLESSLAYFSAYSERDAKTMLREKAQYGYCLAEYHIAANEMTACLPFCGLPGTE